MTLGKVMAGNTLSREESRKTVTKMMEGKLSNEEMAGLLSVLAYRGETAEEISGFAQGMIDKAKSVKLPYEVLDTCGTGGDGLNTFNVSTASAILLSALGVKVAKHGNRSVSSKTGSADVLEILNVPFQSDETEAKEALERYSLSFFFAPVYHEAMKHVAPVRKALKLRTIFNILGPLTNPAQASRRVIGVYSRDAARKMAEASLSLPIEQALFVSGENGLDEISTAGTTYVIELRNGRLQEYQITPESLGIERQSLRDTVVTSSQQSAELIQAIFSKTAPKAAIDLLTINAGAALYIDDKAASIREGREIVQEALGEKVLAHLAQLQETGVDAT